MHGSGSVDDFKKFLESPPIIKSMVAAITIGSNETFVELRYQQDAWFYREADSFEHLTNPAGVPMAPKNLIMGRFGNQYWRLNEPDAELYCDTLTPGKEEEIMHTNGIEVLWRASFFETDHALWLLHLGLSTTTLAPIKWQGNMIKGTNWYGSRFVAILKTNFDGIVTGVSINYDNGYFNGYFANARSQETNEQITIDYEYADRISGWNLPTLISVSGPYKHEVRLIAVELASKPLKI